MIKAIEKLAIKVYKLKRKIQILESQAGDFHEIIDEAKRATIKSNEVLLVQEGELAGLRRDNAYLVDEFNKLTAEYNVLKNDYTAVMFENKRLKARLDGEIETITNEENLEDEYITYDTKCGTTTVPSSDAISASSEGD